MLLEKQYSNKLNLICKHFISVNHYKGVRTSVLKNSGKTKTNFYLTEKAKEFIQQFGLYVYKEKRKQNWITPKKGQLIIVEATFFFNRQDMDANNYWKVLLDILTKQKIWNDDNVVMERVKRIYYDKENPRIELTIYPANNVGIFDSNEEATSFINKNCATCKRTIFKDHCKILETILDNKIDPSISTDFKTCLKKF